MVLYSTNALYTIGLFSQFRQTFVSAIVDLSRLLPPLFQVDISRFRRCKETPLDAIIVAGAAEHASMRHELSWLVIALLSLRSHLLLLLDSIPQAALATPRNWTAPQSRLGPLALFNNARAFQIPDLRPAVLVVYRPVAQGLQLFCLTYFSSRRFFFLAVLALCILCWATSSLRIDSAFFLSFVI